MMKRLFLISRPRFWFYLGGTFLLGIVAAAGSVDDLYQPVILLLLVYFFPLANLYLYGINDVYDQETDSLNEKKNGKEIRFDEDQDRLLKTCLILIGLITVVLFFYLPNRESQIFLLLFFLLSHFYSATPLRFKARPVLDFTSNILYIMPGLVGYTLLAESWPSATTIIAGALWAMAMHLYSAIPDIEPDRNAGVITSAVRFGANTSILICIFLWTLFGALVVFENWFGSFSFLALAYPVLAVYTANNLRVINKIYWVYPWVNTGLGGIAFFFVLNGLL